MCGIVGIIQNTRKIDPSVLKPMLSSIAHRGPEDEGIWVNGTGAVGLGQRRLAIIDLTQGGHQPMIGQDGKYAITFNGEIYNYKELREELKTHGYNFRTESDTEVLLAAYIVWGDGCLQRLNGMFAFAIWDEQKKQLFAARDRMGEKPFKYYLDNERFVFASEIKAILTDKTIKREVDWQAVDLAMTYRYVPSPRTGFKNIYKLPPGHQLTFQSGKLEIKPYWSAFDFAVERHDMDLEEWKKELWSVFKDSVKKRMISDVPVGAFLSGGLDSSSTVAAMSEVSTNPIKTFSVGFKDSKESETPFAKLVSDKFKTDHTEIIIDPKILETIPTLISQYDEPFFDNSAIPTMAMAKETKKFVTVVLTGDGGDECFGGYPSYSFFKQLKRYHNLPQPVYGALVPSLFKLLATFGPRKLQKLHYRAELIGHSSVQAYVDYYGIWKKELNKSNFYLTKTDLYTDNFKKLVDMDESDKLMAAWMGEGKLGGYGTMNRAMLADIISRLADNYMVKVDMASMLHALETRPPFLDHRLVEMALSMPEKFKIKNGDVKWIWKEIVKNKLPEQIITRRKMGFGIPIISWMRNEMYEHLRDELLGEKSYFYDYLDKDVLEKILVDHKEAKADYSNHIWSVLLLKKWLENFFEYGK